MVVRTVDSNGNALGQDEAISTLERWDLALLVDLEVISWRWKWQVDIFEVKTIRLRDSLESHCAWVDFLQRMVISF